MSRTVGQRLASSLAEVGVSQIFGIGKARELIGQ